LRIRERLQKHGVHHRKDRGVRSYTEGERPKGGKSEAGASAKQAKGKLEVSREGFHIHPEFLFSAFALPEKYTRPPLIARSSRVRLLSTGGTKGTVVANLRRYFCTVEYSYLLG